jgi:hypothetical protein
MSNVMGVLYSGVETKRALGHGLHRFGRAYGYGPVA